MTPTTTQWSATSSASARDYATEDLPPVILIHEPAAAHPYSLIEGMRRYNALQREQTKYTTAWVAHLTCC